MLDKTNDQAAADRIQKIRIEMTQTHRFYGQLVANVSFQVTRQVPRAGTNGKVHYWNPDYVVGASHELLFFTQKHESGHDMLKHHVRRNGRDPERWNVACDHVINTTIKSEGGFVPDWCYCDMRFLGMSAEEVYRILEGEEQAAQQQQQQQDQEDQSDDQQDEQQSDAGDDSDDAEGEEPGDDQEDGDEADQGDDQSEDGQGGDAEGQDDGDGDQEGEGAGDQDGDQEGSEGQGEGSGEGQGDAEGEGQGGGQDGDEQSEGEGQSDCPAPRCQDERLADEVFDGGDQPSDLIEEEMKWERITRQAVAVCKGDAPGWAKAEIERSNKPTKDWREELRDFYDSAALKRETWDRLNRRVQWSGLSLPGTKREGLNKVVWIVDTSYSMDDIALQCCANETQAALDDGVIDQIVVVYCDTRVTRVDEYNQGDQIEFNPPGRGGTDMRPAYKFVEDNHDDASLIVNFTDLYIGDPGPEPHCPVLFAVYGTYPQEVQKLIENAPWNAPCIDCGEH